MQLGKLKQLFEEALDLPERERGEFIRVASGGDSTLTGELSSLLAAHDASDGYFERLSEEVIGPAILAIGLNDPEDASGSDRKVAHYEILERIGGGGMGVVYKARDTRLGRTVALKFLPRHHASNPGARARLLAEARAASALDHPNIGVVYEIGEAGDGRPFIAMAWYDGETLKVKARRGPLDFADAVAVAGQLASALMAAHGAGIIHRDVKPANVLVTRSGIVKLVDFGIAKLMSDAGDENHAIAGTVAYMSPEQTVEAPLDVRTDVWSLGVVLYEVLAGKRPFRGETDERTIAAIRHEQPVPLSTLRADVPPQLVSIIEKCLQKNRDERYQTVEELGDALKRWNADSALPSARSRYTSRRALLTFTSVLVLAAIAGTIWYERRSTVASRIALHGTTVAVLPFTDPGQTDSTRYVADMLSEDLRAELKRIRSLIVPSYQSSAGYAGATKPISRIASEMAANFVVTGTIHRGQGDARIEVQVFDGRTGKSVWTGTFAMGNSDLTHIARKSANAVLSQLDIDLTREEKDRLGRPATTNPLAYDFYLRGRYAELSARPRTAVGGARADSMRRAQARYFQARSLDAGFAMARARLAVTHMWSATAYDTTRARLDQARLEAENALRLDSLVSGPHEALAAYWSRQGNAPKAIEELETGLRHAPNDVDLLVPLGVLLIHAGRWEEGIARIERAIQIDPRNPSALWQAAMSSGRARRFAEAQKAFNRLIEVSPDDHEVKLIKGQAYLRWKGSADTLSALLAKIPPGWDSRGMATFARYTALRVQRRYQEGLSMLDNAPSDLSRDGLVYHPRALMQAEMYHGLGDEREARAHYEIARAMMADSAAAHPNDPSIHAALGLALAGLGRKRDAISEAERAMEIEPVSKNSRAATAHMGIAVEIFARVGEHDRAFETLELLLSMPSGREASIPFLRVWPGFDPLRSDPRFDQLLDRFSVK